MKLWRFGCAIEQLGQRYRLDGVLGSGGMADVCLAWDEREQRKVAIKVIKADELDQQILDRFLKEPSHVATWDHPNILRIYSDVRLELLNASQGSVVPYIVMEYAPGGDLQRRLQPGLPYPFADTLLLFSQLCSAVDYAHERGVIHRDIKPSNILFRELPDGAEQAVLSDFGLAVHADASHQTFERAGTLLYMAPEHFKGQAVPASDIFSLGVLLYQLCTGSLPFDRSLRDMRDSQLYSPPAPLSSKDKSLTAALDQAILTALLPEPDQRYQSAKQFWEAVRVTAPDALMLVQRKSGTFPGRPSQKELEDLPQEAPRSDRSASLNSKDLRSGAKPLSIRIYLDEEKAQKGDAPVVSFKSGKVAIPPEDPAPADQPPATRREAGITREIPLFSPGMQDSYDADANLAHNAPAMSPAQLRSHPIPARPESVRSRPVPLQSGAGWYAAPPFQESGKHNVPFPVSGNQQGMADFATIPQQDFPAPFPLAPAALDDVSDLPTRPRSSSSPEHRLDQPFARGVGAGAAPIVRPKDPSIPDLRREMEEAEKLYGRMRKKSSGNSWLTTAIILMTMLLLLSGALAAFFAYRSLNGIATATIAPASKVLADNYDITAVPGTPDPDQHQIAAHPLTADRQALSKVINGTGRVQNQGAQATGTVTFTNSIFNAQTVPAGTALTAAGNVQIVTDANAVIPGANINGVPGQVTVAAHAANAGAAGNIAALALNGTCCVANGSIAVMNQAAFTGGQDAKNYQYVRQADIDAALGPLKQQVLQKANGALKQTMQPGEGLAPQTQCPVDVATDNPVGDTGQNVPTLTLTVAATCSGLAYDQGALQTEVTRMLRDKAVNELGQNYDLHGHTNVSIKAEDMNPDQSFVMHVSASGTWVYKLAGTRIQDLKKMLAGKKADAARGILEKQADVRVVAIDGDHFPTDAGQVNIVVQNV